MRADMITQDTALGYDCLSCGVYVTGDEAYEVMGDIGMQVCFVCVSGCIHN